MTTLAELIAQRSALEEKIAAISKTERADAIAKIHTMMQESGLSLADLRGARGDRTEAHKEGKGAAVPKKAPVKFRDGSGNSWSGRGLQPRWLKAAVAAGKKPEDFAV